jgi:hypothetical protein
VKQAKLLEFIKRWKELELRQKELDYERSRWCADLRAEFPVGKAGDRAFCEWLSLELGIPAERQEECLSRAAAFAIVPDKQEWESLGQFTQIRKLIPLDRRERVAVIGAAKSTGYRIGTVVRQRESKDTTHHPPPDIVLLAEGIEAWGDAPDELRQIARKYIRAKALKVA